MTKTERLAQQEARAKEALAAMQKRLAVVQAQQHAVTRKAKDKRRALVGTMADDAGLFVWSDADLADIFGLLAMLVPCPNPVAVLEGLLGEESSRLSVGGEAFVSHS